MNTNVLTLVAIMLLVRSEATGQASRFEAGVHGGLGLGWLRGNKFIDTTDPLFGPAAEATIQYAFSEKLGVRVGSGYQRKGMLSNLNFTDVNGNMIRQVKARQALDYLVFPVMLRASFGHKARLTVGAGPYAGYLMRSRSIYSAEEIPVTDNTNELEPWDLGISASLGGELPLSDKLRLQAEVRYDKGLTNISALPVIGDGSIRTNAVCLMLGCSYRFGGTI